MALTEEEIITGNSFKNICDDYIDESKPYIDLTKKPKIIFCFTDWIEQFTIKVLPHIDYKFKLITHNADRPVTSSFISLIEDSRLLRWYGMNCHISHEKLTPIPIGIANEKWAHGNKQTLIDVYNKTVPRDKLVYSNFQIHTNPYIRSKVLKCINNKPFIDRGNGNLSFEEYLNALKRYKYVISPAGNSIDCHRVWESIYLGVVPIIEKHLAMEHFYDLPILVVDSFEEICEQTLISNYSLSQNKISEKHRFSYYKHLILSEH